MKSWIIQTILFMDMFGYEPKLTMNKSKTYKTFCGSIMSFLSYALIIYFTAKLSQELYLKQNPTVLTSSQFDQTPRRFSLTLESFSILIGVENAEWMYYIDDRIYSISAEFWITSASPQNGSMIVKSEKFPLHLEVCNLTRHFSNFVDQFKGRDLANVRCISPDNYTNIYLEGRWYEPMYANIVFYVRGCKNTSLNNNTCLSTEIIDENLKGTIVASEFVTTIFDPSNYENPNMFIRHDFFTTISNRYTKTVDFLFKNIDFLTDLGILMEDFSSRQYLQLEQVSEAIELTQSENFFQLYLKLSNIRDIYTRKYKKIQNVIAEVGGLVKGLLVIIRILYSKLAENIFLMDLMNFLFIFPSPGKRNSNTIKSNFHLIIPPGHNDQSNLCIIDKPNPGIYINRSNIIPLEKFSCNRKVKFEKRKFLLPICRLIQISYCPFSWISTQRKQKIQIFQKAREATMDLLEIKCIYRRFQEYEVLSKILLDPVQKKYVTFFSHNIPWIDESLDQSVQENEENSLQNDIIADRIKTYMNLINNL